MRNERGAVGLPGGAGATPLTTAQATQIANRVGYQATNQIFRGQRVFTNGKNFIVQDIDSHSGGMPGGVRMGLNPGATLRLEISDPFELSQVLECEVLSVDSFVSGASVETILVRTSNSLEWQGRRYDYIALRGRQSPGIVDELMLGQTIECSGVGASETTCTSTASQAFEGWRGGLAVRANARLT